MLQRPRSHRDNPNLQRFMFATGIECSYPVITGRDGRSLRVDGCSGHCASYPLNLHVDEFLDRNGATTWRAGPA